MSKYPRLDDIFELVTNDTNVDVMLDVKKQVIEFIDREVQYTRDTAHREDDEDDEDFYIDEDYEDDWTDEDWLDDYDDDYDDDCDDDDDDGYEDDWLDDDDDLDDCLVR